MSLYTEAVMRGMPEGCSDEEASRWWYLRDRDHLAMVVMQRNQIQSLRMALLNPCRFANPEPCGECEACHDIRMALDASAAPTADD